LRKKISNDRDERLIRAEIDNASTDSEGEETRLKMKRKKAAAKAAAAGGGQ